jgi:ketosteroid isomerase-like protein
MATEAEIRLTLHSYGQAQRENNLDAWLELFTDDAVQIDPVGTPARHSKTVSVH